MRPGSVQGSLKIRSETESTFVLPGSGRGNSVIHGMRGELGDTSINIKKKGGGESSSQGSKRENDFEKYEQLVDVLLKV